METYSSLPNIFRPHGNEDCSNIFLSDGAVLIKVNRQIFDEPNAYYSTILFEVVPSVLKLEKNKLWVNQKRSSIGTIRRRIVNKVKIGFVDTSSLNFRHTNPNKRQNDVLYISTS